MVSFVVFSFLYILAGLLIYKLVNDTTRDVTSTIREASKGNLLVFALLFTIIILISPLLFMSVYVHQLYKRIFDKKENVNG